LRLREENKKERRPITTTDKLVLMDWGLIVCAPSSLKDTILRVICVSAGLFNFFLKGAFAMIVDTLLFYEASHGCRSPAASYNAEHIKRYPRIVGGSFDVLPENKFFSNAPKEPVILIRSGAGTYFAPFLDFGAYADVLTISPHQYKYNVKSDYKFVEAIDGVLNLRPVQESNANDFLERLQR